jgi:hypothetical protein
MFKPIKIDSLRALNDHVLVADMNFKERKLSSGIYLLNDDGRGAGIRPRWARVYATGPEQEDIKIGQWILVAHGRWTRGVTIEDQSGEVTIRRIDPNDILLVSDEEPEGDDTLSNATQIDSKSRW